MTDPSTTRSPITAEQRRRNQILAKLIVIAILIAVAILKPKVEAWLAERTGQPADVAFQDSASADSSPSDTVADQPGATVSADQPDLSSTLTITESDESTATSEINSTTAVSAEEDNPAGGPQRTSASKKKSTTTSKSVEVAVNDSPAPRTSRDDASTRQKSSSPAMKTSETPGTSTKASGDSKRSNPDRVPEADVPKSAGTTTGNSNRPSSGSRSNSDDTKTKDPPGKLTLVRGGRANEFVSTAGLKYVSGSEDGHRLKHILQHAKDNPDKPVHGVFDGDRDQILAWIDLAYIKGQKGGKGTRKESEGGRTVYTVDMGEQIGHVGGQVGQRKNNPPCRYLRLVLQNKNEVVTAYPSDRL